MRLQMAEKRLLFSRANDETIERQNSNDDIECLIGKWNNTVLIKTNIEVYKSLLETATGMLLRNRLDSYIQNTEIYTEKKSRNSKRESQTLIIFPPSYYKICTWTFYPTFFNWDILSPDFSFEIYIVDFKFKKKIV